MTAEQMPDSDGRTTDDDMALIGLGNVGRNFLRILETKGERLAEQYGLAFRVVCVADSSGVAVNLEDSIRPRRGSSRKVAAGWQNCRATVPGRRRRRCWPTWPYGLVLEASPVNLQTGEPGLSAARASLRRGIPVVLANKAPLVLAFHELQRPGAGSTAPGWATAPPSAARCR